MRRTAITYEVGPSRLVVVDQGGTWTATADALGSGKTARDALEDLERVLASELVRVRRAREEMT